MGEGEDEREKQTIERPSPSRITQAEFLSWKRQKDIDSSAKRAEAARKRAEDIAAGTVLMNGRELFTHEPSTLPAMEAAYLDRHLYSLKSSSSSSSMGKA